MSQFNSPNSEKQMFSNSKISDDVVDVHILSSKKTYSKKEKSFDYLSEHEKSFHRNSSDYLEYPESLIENLAISKSIPNEKDIASSSLASNKNDFNLNNTSKCIDGNIHTDSKRTFENKPILKDPLLSLFGDEEDTCNTFDCDFTDEDILPIFQYKSYQRTRKNLKRQVVEKRLNLDETQNYRQSNNMLLKSEQTSIQQSSVTLSMNNNVKLSGVGSNVQHSISIGEAKLETTGKCMIDSKDIKTNLSNCNTQCTFNSINGMSMLEFVQKYSEERNPAPIKSGKFRAPKKRVGKATVNETNSIPKSLIQKTGPKSIEVKKSYNKRNNCPIDKGVISEKSTTTLIQCKLDSQTSYRKKTSKSAKGMKCNNIKNNCPESTAIEKSIPTSIQNKSNSINNGHYQKTTEKGSENEVVTNISSKHAVFVSNLDEHKSATQVKLSNDNFKQSESPDVVDIDKYSTQKPLQKSCDALKSESSVPYSLPLPQFCIQSPDISDSNEDSLECDQVIQKEDNSSDMEGKLEDLLECDQVIQKEDNSSDMEGKLECGQVSQKEDISSDMEGKLEDLLNNIESNCLTYLENREVLENSSFEHVTVKKFCDCREVFNTLSKCCGEGSSLHKQSESEENNTEKESSYEKFKNDNIFSVVKGFVLPNLFKIFTFEDLKSQLISTDKILKYAYNEMSSEECIYFTKFFSKREFLTLEAVTTKLSVIGMLIMFDRFKKAK